MFGSWLPPALQLLRMGAGRPAAPPDVNTPEGGWYASDDGLVPAFPEVLFLDPADVRRVWMDYQAVTELIEDATITAATVVVPSGLAGAGSAIVGPRIYVTLYNGVATAEYDVTFRATLDTGAVIQRVGKIRVRPGGG